LRSLWGRRDEPPLNGTERQARQKRQRLVEA